MSVPAADAMAVAPRRPWGAAIGWLFFLGPFFFATYGLANWMASRRAEVGSIVFDWESRIPFLAWTIVPYWSIDLFYGVSLLVCATRSELFTHASRLLAAQVVSVAFFLAFPLTFTFARPAVDGQLGWMFDVLGGFDKPFNQAPSLHIALLIILWVLYARHLAGAVRWVLHFWFALIGVSVLTTFQHHFIDLPTGLWVGWLCVWLFPDAGASMLRSVARTRDPQRLKLATRYALGAGLLAAIALSLGGWALWLLWIAGSLAIVATNYAFLGEGGFQKQPDGTLSAGAAWLLAPYLAGAWVNSRLWTRKRPQPSLVVPGLFIGRLPTGAERSGVRAIVDLAAELPCESRNVQYASIPMLDLVIPSHPQLERAVQAIDSAMKSGPVLVCCALGYSRSAVAVAAWLLSSGRAANAGDAVALIRAARPAIVLGASHLQALERFSPRIVRPALAA